MPQVLAPPVPDLLPVLPTPRRPAPLPAPALATGYPLLDHASPIASRQLTLLDQPPARTTYALVASATLAGRVLVVDGGNRFDAYDLVDAATRLGHRGEDALSATWVARAFTVYQMQALLEETIPRFLAQNAASFVLVSDVAAPYLEEDTPRREGITLYRRALRVLRGIARASTAPVVLTNHGAGLYRDPYLGATAAGLDASVAFRSRGASCLVALSNGVELVCRAEGSTQTLLPEWGAS